MKTPHPSEEKLLQKFKRLPEGRKTQALDFIDFVARISVPLAYSSRGIDEWWGAWQGQGEGA